MNYHPPEAKVEEMLQKFTARQLAIAYLRAKNRAATVALELKITQDLIEVEHAIEAGNPRTAEQILDRATRRMRNA